MVEGSPTIVILLTDMGGIRDQLLQNSIGLFKFFLFLLVGVGVFVVDAGDD
jgi:hypothetical protein